MMAGPRSLHTTDGHDQLPGGGPAEGVGKVLCETMSADRQQKLQGNLMSVVVCSALLLSHPNTPFIPDPTDCHFNLKSLP